MGGSSKSIVNNTFNNRIINKSEIESINNVLSEVSTSQLISNKVKGGAVCINVSDVKLGKINLKNTDATTISDIDIYQECEINFTMQDITNQTNSINNSIAQEIFNSVTSQLSASQLTEAVARAETEAKQGFLALPPPAVNTEANVTINNDQTNEVVRKFSNNIKNQIYNKSASLNFGECISTQMNTSRVKAGTVNIDNSIVEDSVIKIKVNQASKIVKDCIFNTLQNSELIESIATSMGAEVKDDIKAKTSSKADTTVIGKTKSTGFEAFGGVSFASSSCCCIIIIIIIIFVLMKSLKQEEEE